MQARIGFLQGSEVWLFTITRKTQRMYASKHRVPARSRDWFVTISKNTKHTHNAWMQARIGFLQGLIFQQDSEVLFFFHICWNTCNAWMQTEQGSCKIPRLVFFHRFGHASRAKMETKTTARFRGLSFHNFGKHKQRMNANKNLQDSEVWFFTALCMNANKKGFL